MAKQPSRGIILYAIFYIIIGINMISRLISNIIKGSAIVPYGTPTGIFTPIITLVALYHIICGIGIFMLKEWARKNILVIACFFGLFFIIGFIKYLSQILFTLALFTFSMLMILLYVITPFYFFTREKVKGQFLKQQ